MKKIFPLIAISLLISIQSFAQENSQKLLYANKLRQYTSMKRAGATLTLTGIVCIVVGLYKGNNPPVYTGPGKAPSSLTNEVIILMAGGIACTGTGIPLWTIGGYNQQKYQKKLLQNIYLQFSRGHQYKGLTLVYWF
jgi:hypothetical protein